MTTRRLSAEAFTGLYRENNTWGYETATAEGDTVSCLKDDGANGVEGECRGVWHQQCLASLRNGSACVQASSYSSLRSASSCEGLSHGLPQTAAAAALMPATCGCSVSPKAPQEL